MQIRTSLFAPVRLALAAGAAMAALNAQAAEPSRIATAFGNTVVTTYPDGRSQHIWLHPDGTWDGISRRGDTLAGRWTLKDQKVCMRQTKPPTLPISYCTAFPADPHVGVTWTSRDVAGTPIRLTVVRGMDEARAQAPRAQ